MSSAFSQFPGDLFCHVVVETRVSLTERQRTLLREFEGLSAQDSARHNPRAKGWFDKVKEFFEGWKIGVGPRFRRFPLAPQSQAAASGAR